MTATEPDALQKLVRDRLAETGDSARTAANRSAGLISHTSIIRIRNGAYRGKRIGADTIAGLALALQLPQSQVAAAAQEAIRPGRWEAVVDMFPRLDSDLQDRLIEAAHGLLQEQEIRNREQRDRKWLR